MEFAEYQAKAGETAVYPRTAARLYTMIGLCGEVGEIAGKIKRTLRDNVDPNSVEFREALMYELGDTLWYVARMASEYNLDLDNIAYMNLEKLQGRKRDGTLGGEGDVR